MVDWECVQMYTDFDFMRLEIRCSSRLITDGTAWIQDLSGSPVLLLYQTELRLLVLGLLKEHELQIT